MSDLTQDYSHKIVSVLFDAQGGVGDVRQLLDEYYDKRLAKARDALNKQARERERQAQMMSGSILGYEAACGQNMNAIPTASGGTRYAYSNLEKGLGFHGHHKLEDGRTCWGYCDCGYQAPYPHSVGEHK